MNRLRLGSRVVWMWQGRPVQGQILATYFERVVRVIKGKRIVRNGSKQRPAYLVKSKAGNMALKLSTELKKDASVRGKASRPRMFED